MQARNGPSAAVRLTACFLSALWFVSVQIATQFHSGEYSGFPLRSISNDLFVMFLFAQKTAQVLEKQFIVLQWLSAIRSF